MNWALSRVINSKKFGGAVQDERRKKKKKKMKDFYRQKGAETRKLY